MTTISFSVFKDKILSGEKRQTIRKVRKNPIKVGDRLQLYWYQRSANNELLFDTVCTDIVPVRIEENQVSYFVKCSKNVLEKLIKNLDKFAIADGFDNWNHMRNWFQKEHGLPFEGVLIEWEYPEDE